MAEAKTTEASAPTKESAPAPKKASAPAPKKAPASSSSSSDWKAMGFATEARYNHWKKNFSDE